MNRPRRNTLSSLSVTRSGDVFRYEADHPAADFCDNYRGAKPGDSGGALLDANGRLCGVMQGGQVDEIGNDTLRGINWYQEMDSPSVITWLKYHFGDEPLFGQCNEP